MTTTTYENSVRIGSTTYRLVATADPELSLELAGTDTAGALVAEGALRLPADAGARIGKLLSQVLDALGTLAAPSSGSARGRPANANQPWTAEAEESLRAAWLGAAPGAGTAELIRDLARRLERSPASLRSRLAKVGCDPDVPGRALSERAAEVFGVQGRDQGRVGGTPDSRGAEAG
ncbi:hypothetical protein ACFFSW_07745 [Saccharothrix longispora]|uniref:Uncharacterized protein n=1 Tax=Saccharothrix longispora TaxID=33920 RepID=A0ABU1Q6L8_9PSEU|nr:hypothetical protein [Saccharothrix longispora]MDR6598533.1 hypothetical protein [Saccharothrix longispora]